MTNGRSRNARRSVPSQIHVGFVSLLSLLSPPMGATSQETPVPPPEAEATEARRATVSPAGAFLRAVVVPGWGHASIGSYTRGGFYFAAQSAAVYTLLGTRARIRAASDRVRFREGILRSQLAKNGVTEIDVVEQALGKDPELSDVRELVDTRTEQQEDLIALSLFLMFLSGADAYVSAHLAQFPDPLDVEVSPRGGGRMDIALRLKLPN